MSKLSSEPKSTGSSSENHGFTLVEMLVAIAVMLVFTGGVLISQNDYNKSVRLSSIAREVALIARQAQTYGAGGRDEEVTSITDQPYGIYLNSASSSKVTLYEDQGGSDGYDGPSERIETYTLPSEYVINRFCTISSGAAEDCSGGNATDQGNFHIFYERPSLESRFIDEDGNATTTSQVVIEILHEPSGNKQSAVIDATGYINTP